METVKQHDKWAQLSSKTFSLVPIHSLLSGYQFHPQFSPANVQSLNKYIFHLYLTGTGAENSRANTKNVFLCSFSSREKQRWPNWVEKLQNSVTCTRDVSLSLFRHISILSLVCCRSSSFSFTLWAKLFVHFLMCGGFPGLLWRVVSSWFFFFRHSRRFLCRNRSKFLNCSDLLVVFGLSSSGLLRDSYFLYSCATSQCKFCSLGPWSDVSENFFWGGGNKRN